MHDVVISLCFLLLSAGVHVHLGVAYLGRLLLFPNLRSCSDSLAEWSKALDLGSNPEGHGFKSHSYQSSQLTPQLIKCKECLPHIINQPIIFG